MKKASAITSDELIVPWTEQDIESALPARFARAVKADREDPLRSFILDYVQQFEDDHRAGSDIATAEF